MQKSQQWSFNNIQSQIDEIQQTIDTNEKKQVGATQEMTHSLAMLNYYTQLKQDMIKNVNSSTVDMQCSNVFYC